MIMAAVESVSTITRLDDICLIGDANDSDFAVADHANGILIFSSNGELKQHLSQPEDTLAYSIKHCVSTQQLVTLVLDTPGWRVNIYESQADRLFRLSKQIPLPDEPNVPRMKLRWICVTQHGIVWLIAANNFWRIDPNRDESEWQLMHQDLRKNVWFSHMTPLSGSEDRFLAAYKGEYIHEIKFDDEDGFKTVTKDIVPEKLLKELGAYAVDARGNVIMADWQTGDIVMLDSSYNFVKDVGCTGAGQAELMVAADGRVMVGCKETLEVKAFPY